MKSYEIGVLYLPQRVKTAKRIFSCTPGHRILGYGTHSGNGNGNGDENHKGNKNENEHRNGNKNGDRIENRNCNDTWREDRNVSFKHEMKNTQNDDSCSSSSGSSCVDSFPKNLCNNKGSRDTSDESHLVEDNASNRDTHSSSVTDQSTFSRTRFIVSHCTDEERTERLSVNSYNDMDMNFSDENNVNKHSNNHSHSNRVRDNKRVNVNHDNSNERVMKIYFPIPFKVPPDQYCFDIKKSADSDQHTQGDQYFNNRNLIKSEENIRIQSGEEPWVWNRAYTGLRDRFGRTIQEYRGG